MDPKDLARFPFLRAAAGYIASQGLGMEQILNDFIFADAVEMGRNRVYSVLSDGGRVPEFPVADADAALDVLISYAIARIIVSTYPDTYLINRYARAEAEAIYRRLLREDDDFIMLVAEDLDFSIEPVNSGFRMHFTDYLVHSSKMRDSAWKLINQELIGGYVPLSKQRAVRLMQNAVEERIASRLPLTLTDEIISYFHDDTERLKMIVAEAKSRFAGSDLGEYSPERLPPCIKRLMGMAQQGVNIPHSGRFALTAFLRAIGMDVEEIMAVFSLAPDFREELTRYQVEHITGETSGIEYNVPECSTMKSYGICFADEEGDRLCAKSWLKHPLQYYRIKGKDAVKKESEEEKKEGKAGKEESNK